MASDRIVIDPKTLAGQPVVRGTRIPVYMILKILESTKSFDQVLKQYPGLSIEDVQAALEFAGRLANFSEFSTAIEA